MRLWDGERALTPRTVLHEKTLTTSGLAFRYPTEQVDAETDWCCVDDTLHFISVHRRA